METLVNNVINEAYKSFTFNNNDMNVIYDKNKDILIMNIKLKNPRSVWTTHDVRCYMFEMSYFFKTHIFMDDADDYIGIQILDDVYTEKILQINLSYSKLPRVTYFEEIPEDLISEILTYVGINTFFINLSKSVQKVYRRHLELVVSGRINPFKYIKIEKKVDNIELEKNFEHLNTVVMYHLTKPISDDIDLTKIKFSSDQLEGSYLINSGITIKSEVVKNYVLSGDTIISGKMKCGIYFVYIEKYNYALYHYDIICSKKWKFVWDHLEDIHKNIFYQKSGYDKIMYLLKDPKE
jgi:hypothetical protein